MEDRDESIAELERTIRFTERTIAEAEAVLSDENQKDRHERAEEFLRAAQELKKESEHTLEFWKGSTS